ncbi:hypothetical protein [Fodinicurvata sediminis]|uniref:hypothetical protein n=1 Tax=Fodinicurvata sediminis TaxID=1121832 RepID=UPI0003B64848|nr:hypothetical protein [Fodinicurvata sediminis]
MRLDEWRKIKELSNRELGDLLDISTETARCICLSPSEPDFRVPRPHVVAAIWRLTDGQVGPADFYDLPALRPGAPGLQHDTAA